MVDTNPPCITALTPSRGSIKYCLIEFMDPKNTTQHPEEHNDMLYLTYLNKVDYSIVHV